MRVNTGLIGTSNQIDQFKIILYKYYLVSTYVVCERLSVMHKQARLPESFDQIQIPQFTPKLEFSSRLPTPLIEIWTDLGTLGFDIQDQLPLPKLNLDRCWHFGF